MRKITVLFSVIVFCLVTITASQVKAQKKPQRTGPKITDDYISKVNLKGEGIGLGYAIGYWTPAIGMDLRLTIPFHPKMGVQRG